ncbi:MAG: tetratricopeptide repeat protein [Alphaproteobacteria bacterium]|nr:tetratricopeptide repeat protein [Alphaproteobacteria bacterium]
MTAALHQTDHPARVDPQRLLADADQRLAAGDAAGALALFQSAAQGPYGAYAELRRGQILHALGQPGDARAALLRADSLKPGDAPILFALATVARDQGDVATAERYYLAAMRARPQAVEPAVNLATLMRQIGRLDDAARVIERTLQRCGEHARLLEQLGLVALDRNHPADAEHAFRRALALDPDGATLHANLAEALNDQHRWAETVAELDIAIGRLREPGQAHLNRAYALFELGRWAEGWVDFEHRFNRPTMAAAVRRPEHFALPRWRGEALTGPLFVWTEQGLGDEILMGSLLPALLARNLDVVFECSPRLAPLFARSFPALRVIARADKPDTPPAGCTAQIPAGSLFGLLDWTPQAARPVAYLKPDPARVKAARARHPHDGRRLIGLSWASRNPRLGTLKTLPRRALEQLLAVPNTLFLDLQYGETAETRLALSSGAGVEIRRDVDTDVENDIEGLAALLAACDKVVTASNVTAHLAGALGIETHVVVPHGRARMWYWLGDQPASPFYPAVRIHRQAADGSWTPAVVALRAVLTQPTR